MKEKAERVPVRWGFVLPAGIVVAAVVAAVAYYGMAAASNDPQYQKHMFESIKRIVG